jgi:hypothetical protein
MWGKVNLTEDKPRKVTRVNPTTHMKRKEDIKE